MSHLKLHDYQSDAVTWCAEKEATCAILAYDMGLGKTVVSCALMVQKPIKTMIMVPTCLLEQWEKEVILHTGLSVSVYHSSTRKTFIDSNIIITTPSIIANDMRHGFNRFKDVGRIIVDEAHKLRNNKGKVYQKLSIFCESVPCKVFLTGTPICNQSDDIISIICLSNLKIYNKLEYWKHKNYKVKGVILKNILPDIMLRKTQSDTISEMLPNIHHQDIILKISEGEQMDTYNHHVNDPVVLRRILRMRQSLNDHQLVVPEENVLPEEISIKIENIKKIMENVPINDKVIIFSNFTSVLLALMKVLNNAEIYHGGLNMNERGKVLSKFKDMDSKNKILLINLRAGGCGLNLVEANHVILMEPYWNDSEQQQAINRVYRLGQKKEVFVYRLIISNTIETWLKKLQQMKKNISNILIEKKCEIKVDDIVKQKTDLYNLYMCVGVLGLSDKNDKIVNTVLEQIE